MLLLLISLSASHTGYARVNTSKQLLVFSSFGFVKDASFSFHIKSDDLSNIRMFLVSPYEVTNQNLQEYSFVRTCNPNDDYFITHRNFTAPRTNTKETYWNSVIDEQNIYYPVVLHCKQNYTLITVSYKYLNVNSYLDFRDENYAYFYTVVSFIHAFVGMAWFVNILCHSHYCIVLNILFAFLPVLKALLSSVSAYYWEELRKHDNSSPYIHNSYICLTFIYYSSLLAINSFAFSGWSVYRLDFPAQEAVEAMFSSMFFVGGVIQGSYVMTINAAIFSIVLTCIGFLWYLKQNSIYIFDIIKMHDVMESYPSLQTRIRHVKRFLISSLVIFGTTLVVHSGAITFETWPIIGSTVFELGLLSLELTSAFFYFVRKSYLQEDDSVVENQDKEDIEHKLVVCKEPSSSNLVFVQIDN